MKKNIIVTISENQLNNLNSVAEMLRRDGLEITQVFEYGVITGRMEDHTLDSLHKHSEVVSVTTDQQVDIGPPDGEVQ
jgi:hypothetical protein